MGIVSIQLDRARREPLYVQIAERLQAQIREGGLRPGQRLPPARALARRLGVNLITVVNAYRHLQRLSLVHSRVGSGTYVCPWVTSPPAVAAGPAPTFLHLEERQPAPELFPVDTIRQLMNHILDSEGGRAFSYDDIGGYEPLTREIVTQLQAGGMRTDGSEVVVFSGAQQGLSLLLAALVRPGDWVLVERPTYPGVLRLLSRGGARVEAIDVVPDGPDLVALERVLQARPIRLFYCMPVFQNPTGICYSAAGRQAVLDLCSRHGVLVLEDDALSDLDFGHGRWQPLRAAAVDSRNFLYLKSFSQILMPGFRLGFCLASDPVANAVRAAKEQADLLTSGFFQRVLCLFLRHGCFAQHLRHLEAIYRPLLAGALAQAHRVLVPAGFQVAPSQGGTSLWLRLPEVVPPREFFRECIRQGLGVAAGEEFAPDRATENCFCLAFGHVSPEAWAGAVARLRVIAESVSRRAG